jgi:hypothetical protein
MSQTEAIELAASMSVEVQETLAAVQILLQSPQYAVQQVTPAKSVVKTATPKSTGMRATPSSTSSSSSTHEEWEEIQLSSAPSVAAQILEQVVSPIVKANSVGKKRTSSSLSSTPFSGAFAAMSLMSPAAQAPASKRHKLATPKIQSPAPSQHAAVEEQVAEQSGSSWSSISAESVPIVSAVASPAAVKAPAKKGSRAKKSVAQEPEPVPEPIESDPVQTAAEEAPKRGVRAKKAAANVVEQLALEELAPEQPVQEVPQKGKRGSGRGTRATAAVVAPVEEVAAELDVVPAKRGGRGRAVASAVEEMQESIAGLNLLISTHFNIDE